MTTLDEDWWNRARQARARLEAQILAHPDVSLIDIGMDPQGRSDTPVLRVHIRQGEPSALDLPDAIDGIPVRIVWGDYQIQPGPFASGE
jgi:hypothetical protein